MNPYSVLSEVHYKDWRFYVAQSGGRHYLQVRFDGQHGRKWLLSPHMTRSEVVATALKAVLTAEEHEAREEFTYLGEAVFGPHLDVDALYDVCVGTQPDVREVVG